MTIKHVEDDLDQAMDDVLMGGHHHSKAATPDSDADSTSPGSYSAPLPAFSAPYDQATNSGASSDPNLLKSILE